MRTFSTQIARGCGGLCGAGLILCLAPVVAQSASPAPPPDASYSSIPVLSWDDVEADLETFLAWSEDPLAGWDISVPEPSTLIHSGSLRAGTGHSDNPLKRFHPAEQAFFVLEGEAFLNALLPHSSLTLLFFGEWTRYQGNGPADEESLAFGFVEWSIPTSSGSHGVRGTAFYGDQIYDASLSIQAPPIGATFRQLRPEAGFFLTRIVSEQDLIEGAISLSHAFFDDPQNDYLRARLDGEWSREWSPRWSTVSRIGAYREWHRLAVSRQPNGLRLNPSKTLCVTGAELVQKLTGQFFRGALQPSLQAGATLEIDAYGAYDDLYRSWAGLQLKGTWRRLTLEASTRWQETRYDQRQVAFLDPRRLLLGYRSAEFRATLELVHGCSLLAKWEWLESSSRITTDGYTEQRGQVLLEWAY